MNLKSSFKSDLQKEQALSSLLNSYYLEHLRYYNFERVLDLKRQLLGIDLILTHITTKATFYVDEKAQLDYVNESLPTFAFELNYHKNGKVKQGWFFDDSKKTHFYSLVTDIYSDEPSRFTSCKITFVNRQKLIAFLKTKGITRLNLKPFIENSPNNNGKIKIKELDPKKEGYLYYSINNKSERPINLILKLDYLIKIGVAKTLI